MPAIGSSAVIAFLASFENYNTTVFSILSEQTLTTVIATKVRLGISPAISSLAFVIICLTLIAAILYEFFRRRQERKKALESAVKMGKEISSDRLKESSKKVFVLPKSIFVILFLFLVAIIGWQQIIKNNLYGAECIAKAEDAKKSNFADQLKLLQNNADALETEGGDGGTGSTNEYNDIFGDPNLFKNFGGFDN